MTMPLTELLKGLTIKVQHNYHGDWSSYVSGEAHLTESELQAAGVHPTFDPSRGEWWTHFTRTTEEEARAVACACVGHVFGQRLAKHMASSTIPARELPSKKEIAL